MKRARLQKIFGYGCAALTCTFLGLSSVAGAQTYGQTGTQTGHSDRRNDSGNRDHKKSNKFAPAFGIGIGIAREIYRQRELEQVDPQYVEPPATYRPPKRIQPKRIKPKRIKPKRTAKPQRIQLPQNLPVLAKAKPRIYSIGDKPWASETDFLIAMTPGLSRPDLASFLKEYGLSVLSQTRVGLIDQVLLKVAYPDDLSVRRALQLATDDRVFRAQPNYYYYPTANADPQPVSLFAELQYAFDKMRLSQLEDGETGRGVKLAVIDSGIRGTHPALSDAVASSFTAFPDADAESLNFDHGTAVASIIAARTGMRGVAQNVSLMSAQVFRFGESGNMVADSFDIVRGIDWAVSNGAKILNLSFAGSKDKFLADALKRASEKGVIMIAAAGNEGADAPAAYPAAYEDVIAVTATDEEDGLYSFANRGDHVELAAPGVDVLVAAGEEGYGLQTGTSMATAYISGSVALMLEREPQLDVQQIKDRLARSALDLGIAGRDPEFGYGRLDAYKAITNELQSSNEVQADTMSDAAKVTKALDFSGDVPEGDVPQGKGAEKDM
ncbi:Subtilase family protein [Cohaesibacter sp. ES.047]|uniref:S8 family peptidase n=1 Tax=Cohaesibacter sp. ES.047 TaxID=1798205 RepID=UPI000BB6811D|nr:S8 family serine peptidase [Cohaesibacter sp. ES.047]SNY94192.1 Subtilase family protein [Cohaesibacter sp. ES.047]